MPMEVNAATLITEIAARVPDRPAVLRGPTALSYQELTNRAHRLAGYLASRGVGHQFPRTGTAREELGQDRLAQYMLNCSEYVEGLLGGFLARAAPVNVNYRYVEDELRYLLKDAQPAAIQYHATFAETVRQAIDVLESPPVLLQVDDGSGNPLLPGAVGYEEALRSGPPTPQGTPTADDLYILYTGGTTGAPKGVLWRHADATVALFAQRNARQGCEWSRLDERLNAPPRRPHRVMPLAPYMHGAAQWAVIQALCDGNTIVIPEQVAGLDPAHIWQCVQAHDVTTMTIVGDAFGIPLVEELETHPCELPSLRFLLSGGAALSPSTKQRLAAAIPKLTIFETVGSSESGLQGVATGSSGDHGRRRFDGTPTTAVLSEDFSAVLEPDHPDNGWLASAGRVPIGYLGDPERTARTFPVIDGVRYSVPGDRARLLAGNVVEVLGRDAMTINSGGEKVFAEEVEQVIKTHPDVRDSVVCGRPSTRWGTEIVALIAAARPGVSADALVEHCSAHLARYKLPKSVVFVDHIPRSAAGKADYRWAARIALAESGRPSDVLPCSPAGKPLK